MLVEAPPAVEFDKIEDVVRDIARGKMVIVTDDADRENEGDLLMAAEKATPEAVNFMAMHGRGLICVPVSNERAEQLGLQRMVAQNREMYRTDFTVSVDAARGVTTGISAHDRAATIQTIANPSSKPEDLVQPGHIFPLRAKDGGVLRRAGHTEAAVDLARMAGLQHAGVLCEILHDDGTMARLPELMEFRQRHGLRICTIQSLIAHRRLKEKLIGWADGVGPFFLHFPSRGNVRRAWVLKKRTEFEGTSTWNYDTAIPLNRSKANCTPLHACRRNLALSRIGSGDEIMIATIVAALERMNPRYPAATFDAETIVIE